MAGVRTRKGDRGPHRRRFVGKMQDESPEAYAHRKQVEESAVAALNPVWSGNEYYDNGYGYYFNYDVEVPLNGEIKIDGNTKAELEAKRDELVKRMGQDVVDAVYRNDPDAMDEPEEGDEEILNRASELDLADLQYADTVLGLYEYWENQTPEELDMGLTRYDSQGNRIGGRDPRF